MSGFDAKKEDYHAELFLKIRRIEWFSELFSEFVQKNCVKK